VPVKVKVRDFQSIRSADVEIDGFTVVTGSNNSGKTALQRAVRGVFQNTKGTAFVREGAQKCVVEVDFGKDGKVKWSKGTGKRDRPTYNINDGPDIHPGSSVPDEVAAFGVVPIQAGGQEVWPTIAPQFTGQVFLLDRPGSALAEAIADVERVGQLNRALRASETDRRQASAALRVRMEDLVKHEADAKFYEGLDVALNAIKALEPVRESLATVDRAIDGLSSLRDRLTVARAEAARLLPVDAITVPPVQAMQDIQDELEAKQALKQRLEAAQAEAARYDGINDVLVVVDEAPAERVLSAIDVLTDLRDRLEAAREGVKDQRVALQKAEQLQTVTLDAAEAVLVEVGYCPTCRKMAGDE
jgi:DNA repair ATPase RecN